VVKEKRKGCCRDKERKGESEKVGKAAWRRDGLNDEKI